MSLLSWKLGASVAPLLLGSLLCACGPGNVIAKNKSISDVDDQTTTCKVAKDPLNPMIVEWPATSKVNLDRASKGGLVVVSYAGCTLKVLQGCSAKGGYTYTGVTPARDKIDIASQDDLFARLPLGAISLKGELDQGGGLRLDYIAVGQRVASDPPTKLEGDCEGATHYVRTITLGAYALNRTAKAHAAGAVEVNHAGAGIERSEADTRINSSGDVDKCGGSAPSSEDAATTSGCGAPLQLDLAPLNLAGSGGVVSGGFGQNLGGIGKGPTDLQGIDAVGSASLKDVDPDYLQLLQNAKHADKDPAMKPIDKSNAWGALADYKGKNPTKKLAEERRDAWEKQAADLEKLKEQYLADKAKLDKLLALDDDTVPKASKVAYKKEFAEVYEPWKVELGAALGQPVAPAGDASGGTATVESKLGSFRIDVEGGLDVQQLKYSLKDSSNKAVYRPATGGMPAPSLMEGDAGGSGGFVGAILTVPQIPAPGFGLSAIIRYSLGADVNRLLAGLGMRFAFVKPTTSSGIAFGLWASYVKLFQGKQDSANDCTMGHGCTIQYNDLVSATSNGGADFRLGLMYDLALGDIFALTFGGTLSYAVFPYSFAGVDKTGMNPAKGSDVLQGVGATLNAGLGAHF